MATDYLLAAVALGLGARLAGWEAGGRRSRLLWGLGLIALGLSALAGGTYHGFSTTMPDGGAALLWKATVQLLGMMDFLMLSGSIMASVPRRWRIAALAAAGAKLALFALWMTSHDEFRYVVYDYLPSLIAVAAMHLPISRAGASAPLVAGVLLSFAGAAAQRSGLALHRHFNDNDLYHVIQIGAIILFYLGARRLEER